MQKQFCIVRLPHPVGWVGLTFRRVHDRTFWDAFSAGPWLTPRCSVQVFSWHGPVPLPPPSCRITVLKRYSAWTSSLVFLALSFGASIRRMPLAPVNDNQLSRKTSSAGKLEGKGDREAIQEPHCLWEGRLHPPPLRWGSTRFESSSTASICRPHLQHSSRPPAPNPLKFTRGGQCSVASHLAEQLGSRATRSRQTQSSRFVLIFV